MTLAVTPESLNVDDCMPAKPFSISSMKSTQGDIFSTIWSTRRMFASESPTRDENIRVGSKAITGRPHSLPMAFDMSDFPQPGSPTIRSPFSTGSPNFLPSTVQPPKHF